MVFLRADLYYFWGVGQWQETRRIGDRVQILFPAILGLGLHLEVVPGIQVSALGFCGLRL